MAAPLAVLKLSPRVKNVITTLSGCTFHHGVSGERAARRWGRGEDVDECEGIVEESQDDGEK